MPSHDTAAKTIHDAFEMYVPIYTKVGSAYLFQNAVKITQQVRDDKTSYRTPHTNIAEFAWKHLQHAPALLLVQGTGVYQKLTAFYLSGRSSNNAGQELLGMRTYYGKKRNEDLLADKRLFENSSSIFISNCDSVSRTMVFDHHVCFPEKIPCAQCHVLLELCQKIVQLQRAVVQRLIRNIHAILTRNRNITAIIKPHSACSISSRVLSNCIVFEIE